MVVTADGDVGIGTTTPLAKLDIQGTQGQLFSVTDDLSGSIFAVSDISGVPIFDVNSSGVSYFDGKVEIGTATVAAANAAADDLWLRSTGSNGITISSGNAQTGTIFFGDVANAAVAGFRYNHNTGDMAISAEDNITFACDNVGIGTTSPLSKLTIDAPVGNFANGTNAISLNYDGGSSPGDVGGGIVFSQKWWSASAGQQVTGGIYGIKNAGNGVYGGGLAFYTQPSSAADMAQRMIIDTDGNVGIGTDSPAQKLHIKSTTSGPTGIIIENTNNAQSLDLDFWNNAGAVQARIRYNEGAGSFDFSPNVGVGSAMTMLYGGNVGIGITNPNSYDSNADNLVIGSTGANDKNGITIVGGDTDGRGAVYFADTTQNSAGYISYFHSNNSMLFGTSDTTRMVIDSAGAIKFNAYGAGTLVSDASGNITAVTSGAGTGTVTSITKGAGLVVAGSPITTTGSVAVEYAANVQNIITGGSNFIGDTVVSTDQILITNPGSTSTNRRVGRVEIGDLPFLSLAGGTMTGAIIIPEYITHAGDTDTKFGFTAANQFQVIAGGNTNLNVQGNGVDLSYAGSTRLTTQTGGIAITGDLTVTADVGIGTTSPQVPLDVTTSDTGSSFNDGAVQISNTTSASSGGATVMNIRNNYGGGFGTLIKFFRTSVLSSIANISFNSGGTAVNYNTGSDYRLKEDLQTFNGLDILNNISVYNYKWKGVDFRGYGVIAHELQPIFPDAVTGEKDAEEMQSVDYSKLVPVLIKSVQELKKEIELLKQQLNK